MSTSKVLLSTTSVFPEASASAFELAASLGYDALLRADALSVAVLTVRNVLLVVLLVLGIRALVRVPVRHPRTQE